jgi:hypothetical protein
MLTEGVHRTGISALDVSRSLEILNSKMEAPTA